MDEDLLERLKAYFEDHFLSWSKGFAEYFLQQLILDDMQIWDEKFRSITIDAVKGKP